jgi:3-mercaptopyruvate sulfurtransferase SseA
MGMPTRGVDLATVIRNQSYPPRNGEYVSLGIFYFNAGTGARVKITDDGADPSTIVGDAVKFRLLDIPSLIPNNIIIDTEEAILTGNWLEYLGDPTLYGYNYLEGSTVDKVTDKVIWIPYLPVTGFYNIYAWWPTGDPAQRTDNATYIISDWYRDNEFTVNIASPGGEWKSIGNGWFIEGQDEWHGNVITTDNEGSEYSTPPANPSTIVADAVQFELDYAVVVAPKNGYAPTVNIGSAYGIDYTVNTPYTASLIGNGAANITPNWIWTSSNPDIATVDSNGLVSGVSEGNAQILAYTVVNGEIIAGNHGVTVMRLLVDKDWLDAHRGEVKLILSHGASGGFLPLNVTIPGAIPFDTYTLNEVSQTPCSNPNIRYVIKDEAGLKSALGDGGINSDDNIVVFDDSERVYGRGNFAAYLLWVLEMVGHDITRLHLLNGQLRAWFLIGGGTPIADFGTPLPTIYDPNNEQSFNSSLNTTGCFIQQHLTDPEYVWLDAEDPADFAGHHIPCAKNIYFEENFLFPSGDNNAD